MVPMDCDVCGKVLMIWDVREVSDGRRVAKVCKNCLPYDKMEEWTPEHGLVYRREQLDQWKAMVDRNRADAQAQIERMRNDPKFTNIINTLQPQPYDPGFTGPEPGAGERYVERKKTRPWASHTFWWLLHNCVAHFLIGVLPLTPIFRFHDWTSYRMHGRRGPEDVEQ